MDHPKFLALSDGAWRLWCEGLSYCQKHLTDGVIQVSALKRFRYFAPAKVKLLLTPYQPGANALWTQREDAMALLVHDYLQWNDSRQQVLAARTAAQDRRQRYRDKRASDDASVDASALPSRTVLETANVPRGVSLRSSDLASEADLSPRARELRVEPEDSSESRPKRAGDFVERYQDLHLKYRGVAYIGNPRKDYEEAILLVQAHDDSTLDQLATVFLNADDDFARNGTATVAKFRSRATWCHERLNAEKRRRGIA